MTEALIEAVAHAIRHHFPGADKAYGEHVQCAKDALTAIEASGTHVVVPVEPTYAMTSKGFEASAFCDCVQPLHPAKSYAAMLAARPKVTE